MTVHVDLSPLIKFKERVLQKSGHVRVALKQWAAIYRGFIQERFDKYSKGGGNWRALSPVTIAGRRKGSGVSAVATILRDTGTLFVALDPGKLNPGAIEKHTAFGVTVGYGGSGSHPKGKMTIAKLAAIHDQGLGRMPQRQIIVGPDAKTLKLMTKAMDRALQHESK